MVAVAPPMIAGAHKGRRYERLTTGGNEMSTMTDRIALVRSEQKRLGDYFQTLSAEQWSTRSACDAWENHDVVAHLCMAVDLFSSNIGRAVGGDSTPPEGAPPPGPDALAARMAANAQRAVATRQELGDRLLPHFASQCESLGEALSELNPEDWDKPCYHPAAVISVGTYVDLRLTEMAVHEWDIRSGIESSPEVAPDVLPAVFDLLPKFVVGRLYRPGESINGATSFRFNITGAVSGSFDITVGDGDPRIGPAGDGPAAATFGCDASTFALVVYGRIGLHEAISSGQVTADGEPALIAAFAE